MGAGKTPLILLSAPHDDCDYKGKGYCKGFPAALVPKNFVGGATSYGGFVSCDISAARGGAVDACKALNSLNAQTGLVSESVLDAINKALYCDGSAALTRAAIEGVGLGDLGGVLPDVAPRVKLPLKALLREGLGIKESGLLAYADLVVGDGETYAATPEAFKIAEAGLVTGDSVGVKRFSSAKDHPGDLAASLSLDAVGALLFAASVQGDGRSARGLLDFDIDEDFFTGLGIDFVEECDKFVAVPGGEESAPTICFVRPRVIELLGPPLSTYGYFPAKQPLMLSIRGNRALAPRVTSRFPEELPVVAAGEGGESAYSPTGELYEVELGGVSLSFYALEVDESKPADEFGNLAVKRDE
ncbi:MAG TPA: hypothetical protein PLY45_05885, partial [bacterium]|nr:hypothetical protein [bacterium]